MGKLLHKLFGGLNMTWPKVIIFAIAAGVYTALMALWVPASHAGIAGLSRISLYDHPSA